MTFGALRRTGKGHTRIAMLQHTYLIELESRDRRAEYLREAWNDAVAGEARQTRPGRLLAALIALVAILSARRRPAPAWSPATVAGNDRAGLLAA